MKRLISLLLALVLICGLIPTALAASAPAVSSNLDDHWYVNGQRWATPIYSNLSYDVKNNKYVRAECIGDELVIEYYNQKFQFLTGKTIPLELPIFGGVYMADDYNFLVVGQENFEESDSKEVFRIIRYTKDWEKVDHASIHGANTTIPFDAGSLRFDRSGDILYIRTAHEMYTTEDGVNHQANVMIAIRISTMTVTDQLTKVWNNAYGYVSHSFNQFVRVDGNTLLAVDHGDALPRSVVLFRYSKEAGSETFYGRTAMVNVLPIVDFPHYNDTGVSVGGFECSSTNYLIAGNSYDQKEAPNTRNVPRNIFVTATPKNDFTDKGTKLHWLTHYTESDQVDVSPPHLLKVSNDRFFLTWTEDDVLKYCILNGKGELMGEIQTKNGFHLSDCAPILVDGKAVWYVTDWSEPVFYQIAADACSHSYTAKITEPTCVGAGSTSYTCKHCGYSYTESIPALGHSFNGTDCTRCGYSRKTPFNDVEEGSYYEAPVAWAVAGGITNGISATDFGSLINCNRAQVVTFLWRAAGSPEPQSTNNPFVDVQKGSFYEKPVLWAVEKGITTGTDATHFDPNGNCNRASVVTFLWRAANKPATGRTDMPFVDIPAGSWYAEPVLWALEKGITTGTDATHFSPNGTCFRAQVVTFLYRAFGK